MSSDDAEFVEFAQASASRLRDLAYLMSRDWHLAEDLTQTALTKVYLAWRRLARADNPQSYARKVLLRVFLDHRRRRSSAEVVCDDIRDPSHIRGSSREENPALRLTLLQAVSTLAPRDRAIVLLRYWEDYSVEQVADILDITPGMVRTQSMRCLARLREGLDADRVVLLNG